MRKVSSTLLVTGLDFCCMNYLLPFISCNVTRRAISLKKTLMLWKIEGKRRRGWQKMRWLDSIADSINTNLSKLWEIVEDRGVRAQRLSNKNSKTIYDVGIQLFTLEKNEIIFCKSFSVKQRLSTLLFLPSFFLSGFHCINLRLEPRFKKKSSFSIFPFCSLFVTIATTIASTHQPQSLLSGVFIQLSLHL